MGDNIELGLFIDTLNNAINPVKAEQERLIKEEKSIIRKSCALFGIKNCESYIGKKLANFRNDTIKKYGKSAKANELQKNYHIRLLLDLDVRLGNLFSKNTE